MNKLRKVGLLIFLLFLYTTICAITYVDAVSSNISDNVFRLHVIANSNTEEDQNLKYIVRDEVIGYVETLTSNSTNKEEITQVINNNLDSIKAIAETTVVKNGFNYPVSIELGNFEFPTKEYGDISLPAGFYDGLKVNIGNAIGENWWCVMFPPLCFIDVTSGIVPDESKEILDDNLEDEEFALISSNEETVQFKFRLIEMFQDIGISLGQNEE